MVYETGPRSGRAQRPSGGITGKNSSREIGRIMKMKYLGVPNALVFVPVTLVTILGDPESCATDPGCPIRARTAAPQLGPESCRSSGERLTNTLCERETEPGSGDAHSRMVSEPPTVGYFGCNGSSSHQTGRYPVQASGSERGPWLIITAKRCHRGGNARWQKKEANSCTVQALNAPNHHLIWRAIPLQVKRSLSDMPI